MLLTTTLTLLAGFGGGDSHDFVVSPGDFVVYDTSSGPLRVRDLIIGAGGTLRVEGERAFILQAGRLVQIDGTLDLSGTDARDVATLNTATFPERGAHGGPGGGEGGTASSVKDNSTPAGLAGLGSDATASGGAGGESGYAPTTMSRDARRPGGGGGGVLALDQPESDDPADPANIGLIAESGEDGNVASTGALSGTSPARGGSKGISVFRDGDPTNDFWGFGLSGGGQLIVGELAFPVGGRGGGAGGDAVPSSVFPHPNFSSASDEKGGAGGGGGGLSLLQTRQLAIGPFGQVLADGGDGARGENVLFLDSIGGNGGGGSGGYVVVRANAIDLSLVSGIAFSAVGGQGPDNRSSSTDGSGGNGGPGVIQLHTPDAAGIQLPPGADLADISRPDAWSLLQR